MDTLKIKVNGNDFVVTFKEPKNFEQLDFYVKLEQISKNENQISRQIEGLKLKDTLIRKYTNLNEQQIKQLDLSDKAKIWGEIRDMMSESKYQEAEKNLEK